jgi:hypothetical protein
MYVSVVWDDEPDGNVEHISEHGLSPEEVEDVLLNDALPTQFSKSTGRPCKFGPLQLENLSSGFGTNWLKTLE